MMSSSPTVTVRLIWKQPPTGYAKQSIYLKTQPDRKMGRAKALTSGESCKRLSPSLNRLRAGIVVQDGNLCD